MKAATSVALGTDSSCDPEDIISKHESSICITTMRENTSNQQRSVGSKMLFETALAVYVDVFAIPFVQ